MPETSVPVSSAIATAIAEAVMDYDALEPIVAKKSKPDDVSVAGGDNIAISRYVSPALTTFDNKQHDLGASAVETVIKMIKGKKAENVILSTDIIVREST